MRVYIFGNKRDELTAPVVRNAVSLLASKGVQAIASPELSDIGTETAPLEEAAQQGIDMMICFGGDGTIMRAARAQSSFEIPILGINMGKVGFLAGLEPSQMEEGICAALDGNGIVEKRLALSININGEQRYAINDVNFIKPLEKHLVTFSATADGQMIYRFRADGVIVSSPTGSTAYSLAAGGPIVMPEADCMVITPVCPQTMDARSVVVNGRAKLFIEADGMTPVFVDGNGCGSAESIEVTKADFTVNLVRMYERDYCALLHKKLSIKD